MRYTRYDMGLGRYVVPLLVNPHTNEVIRFNVYAVHDSEGPVPEASCVFGEVIDRLAELENQAENARIVTPAQIYAEVTDSIFECLPLTRAEMLARLERELTQKLAREIIAKDLYTLAEEVTSGGKRYRAVVKVLPPAKEV